MSEDQQLAAQQKLRSKQSDLEYVANSYRRFSSRMHNAYWLSWHRWRSTAGRDQNRGYGSFVERAVCTVLRCRVQPDSEGHRQAEPAA